MTRIGPHRGHTAVDFAVWLNPPSPDRVVACELTFDEPAIVESVTIGGVSAAVRGMDQLRRFRADVRLPEGEGGAIVVAYLGAVPPEVRLVSARPREALRGRVARSAIVDGEGEP